MHYFIVLMKFEFKSGLDKALSSLKTFFQKSDQSITLNTTKDGLHALFVVSSTSAFDEDLVRVFKIHNRTKILFSHLTTSQIQNLSVLSVVHSYTTRERLEKTTDIYNAAVKHFNNTAGVLYSDFRVVYSAVLLDTSEPLDPMTVSTHLQTINPLWHESLTFFSAALQTA